MVRVILPVSTGHQSQAGLEVARTLASSLDADVILVAVVESTEGRGRSVAADECSFAEHLQSLSAEVGEDGRVTSQVLAGDPVEEINRLTEATQGCILVLTPRWSGDSSTFMPESVSAALIERVRVPVILVTESAWDPARSVTSVMVPITENAPAAEHLIELHHLLTPPEAVFRVVRILSHVDQPDSVDVDALPTSDMAREEHVAYQAQLRLIQLNALLRNRGIRSNWELRYGEPVHEIVRASDTTETDLIAFIGPTLTSQSRSELARTALSVSYRAGAPVLLFPRESTLPAPIDTSRTVESNSG